MRRTQKLLIALTPLLLALFSLGTRAAEPAPQIALPLLGCPGCDGQPSVPTPDASEYASEAVRLINQAREAAGCPAAIQHPTLMWATQDWSRYMDLTGDYRHSPSNYYSDPPYFYYGGLENIGVSGFPSEIVGGWLDSPTHKSNIEFCIMPGEPGYRSDRVYEIGVGHSGGYWTMVLVDR
jgi:hypothetical protein